LIYRIARFNLVPIVYGLGSYDTVAPPHSYINVFDFDSVRDLADYLLYLDGNDTAYNEYFWLVGKLLINHILIYPIHIITQ